MRLTGKLVPGVLLALPLVLVGILAAYGWKLEIQTLQDGRLQLLQEQLQQTEAAIHQMTGELVAEAMQQVKTALQTDELNMPRNLVLTSDLLSFLVLYRGNQRLFPPEESNRLLTPERTRLDMLVVALKVARDQLQQQDSYQQSVFDIYQQRYTVFHCQNQADGQICLLLHPDKLAAVMQTLLQTINANNQGREISLLSVNGSVPDETTQQHRLSAPLQEFTLQAQWHTAGDFRPGYLSGLLTIILPLLTSWVLLVWLLYRRQQADLQANNQRAELTAQLSHELRTPLANLRLYTDLLRRKANAPDSVRHYSDVLEQEINRLGKLTEQAIAAARGKPQHAHLSSASPDQVIRQLIERFASLWQQSGCTLHFSGQAEKALLFDQAALESVLLQLLDNACKYASPGEIDIRTRLDEGYLYLQVRDFGAGLPVTELESIFYAETRGSQNQSKQDFGRGFGLGLAAARYFTHLNNGELTVENVSPGLCFTATLSVREPG